MMTRAFAQHAATGLSVTVTFDRSRANGGLDSNGALQEAVEPGAAVGTIVVLGKFAA